LNSESEHLEDTVGFWSLILGGGVLGSDEGVLPTAAQVYPEVAYDTSFWTDRAPVNYIGAIHVPTFIVGGTYDVFQRGEPINYNALDLPLSEKKLLIGPWYHITTGSGLPATDVDGNRIPDLNDLMIDWYDHWLRWPTGSPHSSGATNGINEFPTVESYDLGADTWVPGTQYPASGTSGQRWYLGPQGTLSTSKPTHGEAAGSLPSVTATGTCSRSTWQWTMGLPTEVGEPSPLCENDSTITEAQGLTFTTAPMTSPYIISGPLEADIFMSSTAKDSTVIATLSDVSSGGASDITAGTLVASLRAVTTTPCRSQTDSATEVNYEVVRNCSQYLDGQSINPWHPYSEVSQKPLQPGTVYELRIEVFPTDATIEPGQELRLTITTSDLPHELQTLSTASNAVGIDTFYVGGNTPSSIYLGTTTSSDR
jgi:putative CocE/NonD family hydrolase